jgi:hypothetical protein
MSQPPDVPAQKLRMMKRSVRCLALGLLGLVPLVGVPFALAALWTSYGVRRQERLFWNPAKPHRVVGLISASVGALLWSIVDTILIYNGVNAYIQS